MFLPFSFEKIKAFTSPNACPFTFLPAPPWKLGNQAQVYTGINKAYLYIPCPFMDQTYKSGMIAVYLSTVTYIKSKW